MRSWVVAVVTICGGFADARGQRADSAFQFLPQGDVFAPLLADPKQPEFVATVVHLRSTIRRTTVGAAAFGESVGLARWTHAAWSLQLGLAAGVFAQFDLGSYSIDLLNADYIVGLPVTYRRGTFAVRARLYHQSSHLGDEFLLVDRPERVNLSFESVEVLFALSRSGARAYGGAEYLVRHEPRELASGLLHAGLDYRGEASLFRLGALGRAHVAAGLDMKAGKEHAWEPGCGARAGLEFRPPGSMRQWSVLFTGYRGPAPYGQFYDEDVQYFGIGIHLAL